MTEKEKSSSPARVFTFFHQNGNLQFDVSTAQLEREVVVELVSWLWDRGWYSGLAGSYVHDEKKQLHEMIAKRGDLVELGASKWGTEIKGLSMNIETQKKYVSDLEYQRNALIRALGGDHRSAENLLEARSGYEYESWQIEELLMPTDIKRWRENIKKRQLRQQES